MKKNFRMTTGMIIAIFLFWIIILISTNTKSQPVTGALIKQQLFEKMFGDKVQLDTDMVQKVKADMHGKRHYVDVDGNGKPEEVWFIDTDPRHHADKRPMLVRVYDEDGDLSVGKEPDLDSDLYIADWNADGLVDAAVDYRDMDGDQDVDEMELYFYGKFGKEECLRIWWARDDGDDNLLWYTVNYQYYQRPCQNLSHFGGDETFNYLYLTQTADKIMPIFENPFLFYDHDKDGVTEDVIRIEGVGDTLHYLRWSFDADKDATIGQPRDFDVTIAACGPGWTEEKKRGSDFNLVVNEEIGDILTIRGKKTLPILKRSVAPGFLNDVTWARVQMTWDENDLNRAAIVVDSFERWEGIIAPENKEPGFYFPQIGGPVCSVFNKRTEIVLSPGGPTEYYFSPADNRIHLRNCDRAFIRVDFNYDSIADMNYNWYDTNKDGLLDNLTIDVDGDNQVDDSYNLDVSNVKSLNWVFGEVNSVFGAVVKNEPPKLYLLNKSLRAALESIDKSTAQEPIWDMLHKKMRAGEQVSDDIADRLINSDETLMYYLRLVRDRQIAKLKKVHAGNKSFWKAFEAARGKDDSKTLTNMLVKTFKLAPPVQDYESWIASLRKKDDGPLVAWDNQWVPPSWIWESKKSAFRLYDGHLDMFGKREEQLVLPLFQKGLSYHIDQSWGMDILHVNKTSGCGGLTLYVNGVPYPVRNEKAPGDPTFTGRLVEETGNKVTIELLAKGVGPADAPYTVKWRPSALAGRADSPLEVIVEGGKQSDKIELGIGLTRMNDETFISDTKNGIICSWGFQEPGIGWIGIGVVYPVSQFVRVDTLSDEHQVILRCEKGKPMVYHIQGDWLRGHQFPCCPAADDWYNKMKKTAAMINL
ncbi:MAG: DUF4861 family protein [Prolixibacteraceae bacterium]|jgi:hypothetical protein|nr:DUF4861 family protein [Prolixibacteraceae bacterium]